MVNSKGKIDDDNDAPESLENIIHRIIYQYLHDATNNKWIRSECTPDGKTKVETTPATGAGTQQEVILVDPTDNTKKASIDPSGRQLVSTQPPSTPASGTSVVQIADGNLSNNEVNNTFYVVTNLKTLTIQRFTAAASGGVTDGWECSLYLDPNGVGNATSGIQGSWSLISLALLPEIGGNFFEDLIPTNLVGDGTARAVLRRVRLGAGGAKRGFVKFTGFES